MPNSLSADGPEAPEWGARFTARVVRNIRMAKDAAGLTTEELAKRCNEFLGSPGNVRPTTLNGLFAGKRRSIGIHELVMFATALQVSVISLLVDASDEIEVRPGRAMDGVLAMRTFVGLESWAWGPANPLHMWFGQDSPHSSGIDLRAWVVLEHFRAEEQLFDAFGKLLDAIDGDRSELSLNALLQIAQDAMSQYRVALDRLYDRALKPPMLPSFLEWVPSVEPNKLTLSFARQVAEQRRKDLEAYAPKTAADDG